MGLIQKLAEIGKIDAKKEKELEDELLASGKREEDLILEKKLVTPEILFSAKSEVLGVPFLPDAEGLEVPNKTLALIPEDSARFYRLMPLSLKEEILEVGMVDPEDIKAKEVLLFLARQHRFSYKIFLITPGAFDILSKQYRNLREEVGAALEALETEEGEDVEAMVEVGVGRPSERLVEEAPIIKMVSVILRHAVEGQASDIHIEPVSKNLRVRFRMDGTLYSSLFLPLAVHPSVVARIKILSNLRIDETRIPQDGRFSARIGEKEIDFRVSTFPTKLGEKVVLRVLDPTEGLKDFKDLGLSDRNMKIVQEALQKPFGLILSTGPTGSGKSTTLYTLLRALNKDDTNVVTLEDPVEYFMEGISQSQIRPEIGYDFPSGLRSIVRQDPDVIMVGEIRDEESASLVIHSALTGHVVLSTIHTNNAIGVMPRFVDMQVKPFLIPSTLNVAIAQRLARRLCPYCKKKVKAPKPIEDIILKDIAGMPEDVRKTVEASAGNIYIYEAVGCKKCNEKGVKGRVGIYEVLRMTDSLGEAIMTDISDNNLNREVKKQGMVTLRQDAILKALEGSISFDEVLWVAEE
ncbi:MAG: GspE/PulE family protein [Candidatus Paceibacterota bacterium]|jgi:type IV pilus assembly protein PilB